MPTELNEQSTTEEVKEYVESVAQEVEAERKGDAEITSEHADNEKKQPVADSGDGDSTDGDSTDGETADGKTEGEAGEWLTDDLKAEVAAYGIDEEELADFTSREELERALRVFDKTALESGRKAMSKQAESEQESEEKKESPKEGQYEIGLDKDVHDEELVGELTKMRDHYESRLSELESRFVEADAKAEEQHFDSIVDALGHGDLFGKSGKENSKQLERRQDLFVQVKAHQLGLSQLGRSTDLDQSLVNRVARMVFAEDLGKKEWKAKTRKISSQSNGRQGGGATRPNDPREDPRDEFDRLYKELEGQ